MVIAQAIANTGLLTHDEVMEILPRGLDGRFAGQKVLVLIPDHTRSLPLPELFRMLVEVLHDAGKLNFMVALGTHPGYSEAGLNHLVGITAEERATTFRRIGPLNHAWGVTPFYNHFEHNGVTGPDMATVYSDRGQGIRAPVVFYNRSNEAGAQLKPGDFDWEKIFTGGVRWFHSGGIFATLSETTGQLIIEGMKAAKAHGAITSEEKNL